MNRISRILTCSLFFLSLSYSSLTWAIAIGDRVKVIGIAVGSTLQVRSCGGISASCAPYTSGSQVNGALGTVNAGGSAADNHIWYEVFWDNGAAGWSAADYLQTVQVADNPPTFSNVTTSLLIKNGSFKALDGFMSDDNLISSNQVYVQKVGGTQLLVYQREPKTKTFDLSNFLFDTKEAYATGLGNYLVTISAKDDKNQAANIVITVTVYDNASQIAELQKQIDALKAAKATKQITISQTIATNTNLATTSSTYQTTLTTYTSTLSNLGLPSPVAENNTTNSVKLPKGCDSIEDVPATFPLERGTSYKHSIKCTGNSKGTVYFLLGFHKTCAEIICNTKNTVFQGAYPAAILFLPNDMAPMLQYVTNSDQAIFWVTVYTEALSSNLDSALAKNGLNIKTLSTNTKANPNALSPNASPSLSQISHPNIEQLKAILEEYKEVRTSIRDYIEESIYDLGDDVTAEDVKIVTEILSAGLGSVPYVQEAKYGVELFGGEDILTGEPVTLVDGLSYIIPGQKALAVFAKYKGFARITRLIGNNESEFIAKAKNLLNPTKRKTANEIGKVGDVHVRTNYSEDFVGKPVTKSIPMKEGLRKPDGLNDTVLSEIKNRKSVSCTSQLRDYTDFALNRKPNQLIFKLFIRNDPVLINKINKNPSFLKGGKCFPIEIIPTNMPFNI
jgi:hypothetical protein